MNNKINRIRERPLRVAYDNNKSNFKGLLERDHSFAIHKRSMQYLAIYKNGFSTIIMNDVFQFIKTSACELRSGNHLKRTNIQTVHFGSEYIKSPEAKIWNPTTMDIKNFQILLLYLKKRKSIGLRIALVAFAGYMLVNLL